MHPEKEACQDPQVREASKVSLGVLENLEVKDSQVPEALVALGDLLDRLVKVDLEERQEHQAHQAVEDLMEHLVRGELMALLDHQGNKVAREREEHLEKEEDLELQAQLDSLEKGVHQENLVSFKSRFVRKETFLKQMKDD